MVSYTAQSPSSVSQPGRCLPIAWGSGGRRRRGCVGFGFASGWFRLTAGSRVPQHTQNPKKHPVKILVVPSMIHHLNLVAIYPVRSWCVRNGDGHRAPLSAVYSPMCRATLAMNQTMTAAGCNFPRRSPRQTAESFSGNAIFPSVWRPRDGPRRNPWNISPNGIPIAHKASSGYPKSAWLT